MSKILRITRIILVSFFQSSPLRPFIQYFTPVSPCFSPSPQVTATQLHATVSTCHCATITLPLGMTLVFIVEDEKLQLIVEKETKGAIYSLNVLNGKLLAAINQKIRLYKWMLRDDGFCELQSECGHHAHILALYMQTRGDFIIVGASDEINFSVNLQGKHIKSPEVGFLISS
ncbi:CPSF A domain-containing protein [Abeliophyllum distichum]|uniref:CPSF A domain-containing protein n=1 Tax=Abeliophyllum distichum TaxID=126358 RepID=A0ABD1RQT6_9LAMI